MLRSVWTVGGVVGFVAACSSTNITPSPDGGGGTAGADAAMGGSAGASTDAGADVDAGDPVPPECVGSDIIASCPAGSNPQFNTMAQALCNAAQTDDLVVEENNSDCDSIFCVTGQCISDQQCTALCRFEDPCECGVQSLSRDAVVCSPCTTACGNGTCEAGEDDVTCDIDCAPTCVAGTERCFGDSIQTCDLRGFWEPPRPCGIGSACSFDAMSKTALCSG